MAWMANSLPWAGIVEMSRVGRGTSLSARPHPPFCRPRRHSILADLGLCGRRSDAGGVAPPDSPVRPGCISPGQGPARPLGGIRRPHDLMQRTRSEDIFRESGAGGNRTPVHQAMNVRDTTIPDSLANAARPAGRLTVASGGPRSVFAECQQTFLQSAVFPAAIPRFCCRAAVDRPRAPFLVTMSLRSPKN